MKKRKKEKEKGKTFTDELVPLATTMNGYYLQPYYYGSWLYASISLVIVHIWNMNKQS